MVASPASAAWSRGRPASAATGAPRALAAAFVVGLPLGALAVAMVSGSGADALSGLVLGAADRRAPGRLRNAARLGLHQRPWRLRPLPSLAAFARRHGSVHGCRHGDRRDHACGGPAMIARQTLVALASGLLFGGGLAISGMADPARVRAFLDIFGAWDPTLAFVMAGALVPMAIAWRIRAHLTRPVAAPAYDLPDTQAHRRATGRGGRRLRCRLGARRPLPWSGGGGARPRPGPGGSFRDRDAGRHGAAPGRPRPRPDGSAGTFMRTHG